MLPLIITIFIIITNGAAFADEAPSTLTPQLGPKVLWDPAVAETGSIRKEAQDLEVTGCFRCLICFLVAWLCGSGQPTPTWCKHELGQGRCLTTEWAGPQGPQGLGVSPTQP